MNRKIPIKVDPTYIKARMKELGYTYREIEELSAGKITEISLKHFLNKGNTTDEETLDMLADLLNCSKVELVDKKSILSMNLPFELNCLVDKLFLSNREDINLNYSRIIKNFRTEVDLKTILSRAHYLFDILASKEWTFDRTAFIEAYNVIVERFINDDSICNAQITGIQDTVAQNLYTKITSASGEYNTQQLLLMFLYVFILFDAIIMQESVASITQLVPERKTQTADSYLVLTYRCEKMRNALIEMILYKGGQFDNPQIIIDNGIDNEVIEAIVLMLAACEKCYQHIHSDFVDSEYINRAALSAILRRLEKIFLTLDIPLQEDNYFIEYCSMNTTRFGLYYNNLKMLFNSLNPPRKRHDKAQDSLIFGFLIGLNKK